MSKEQLLLHQYKNDVMNLVQSAKKLIPRSKQDQIFSECFYSLKNNEQKCIPGQLQSTKISNFLKNIFKLFIFIFILAIFIYILLNFHQPTSSLVLRNVQGFIYPGLKILRHLSVPVIQRFPFLTGFYDESCLVENPFFYVQEMECWPCLNVYSLIEITGKQNQSIYMSGIPHITKTSHQPVPYEVLKNLYEQNKYLFYEESSSISSTSDKINNLKELFDEYSDKLNSSDIHVSWRINRMSFARILRSLFPRPESMPERSGQSVERFIMIDGAKAPPYTLPGTECSYISVRQAIGQRIIVLKPSLECSQECRTVSIVLNSSIILWYNWWYWRPISLPMGNATDLSISYITSYC
ncbi:uncharacterized protein LOC123685043 [Harmonia axyridis]|uniref:uncharacterized protein LOC123685043 n=1 Tax=Harmonia axyridis TaxID=115357 RepID=UPI001E275634|nr:uncharacterized protein LOC123685043 [Harmonia axyridis]